MRFYWTGWRTVGVTYVLECCRSNSWGPWGNLWHPWGRRCQGWTYLTYKILVWRLGHLAILGYIFLFLLQYWNDWNNLLGVHLRLCSLLKSCRRFRIKLSSPVIDRFLGYDDGRPWGGYFGHQKTVPNTVQLYWFNVSFNRTDFAHHSGELILSENNSELEI